MEIRDNQVEWAVVARLRDLLEASSASEFEVTEAFAHFSTIICWVTQRMRTKGDSASDRAAIRFYEDMRRKQLSDVPGGFSGPQMHVAEALIAIRNACAHADGTSVQPLHHRSKGRPPSLTGFAFAGSAGTLQLSSQKMVEFGVWVADNFVLALSELPNGTSDRSYVNEVVGAIREIRV